MMGEGPVSWKCAKQKIVAQSTCESELVALTLAAKEAIWQAKIFKALKGKECGVVVIYEDNAAAHIISENRKYSERTKHIALRHFFVQDAVESGAVKVVKCTTHEQLADIFTKPLGRHQVPGLAPQDRSATSSAIICGNKKQR